MIEKYRPLLINLGLAALAVVAGAFLYATQDDEAFKIDLALFSAVIWAAIRGAVGLFLAWKQNRRPS